VNTLEPPEPAGNDEPRWPRTPLPGTRRASGKSHAENVRHTLAFAALWNEIAQDQRTIALFQRWAAESGLAQRLADAIPLLDDMAVRAGLPHRFALREVTSLYVTAADPNEAMRFGSAAQRALGAFFAAWEVPPSASIASEAEAFVAHELRLPWLWLAAELVGMFHEAMLGQLWGVPVSTSLLVDGTPRVRQPIPPFIPRLGDPIEELERRLRAYLAERIAEGRRRPHRLPIGRVPDLDQMQQTYPYRATQWLYRNLALEQSIHKIAADAGMEPKDIRDGIKTAKRLLDLAG
jgi:hypothetical protein